MGRKAFSTDFAEENGLAGDRYPQTDKEVEKAITAIESDLEKLPFVEREKIVFDIHGFDIGNKNDGMDGTTIEEQLKTLEDELQKMKLSQKTAYEHALYLNPDYVESRELREMFLISSQGDPVLAADQIVQHFETKKNLFGIGNVLGRPVLQSDLTSEEMEMLNSNCMQVLPSRDAAGRVVVFCAPLGGGGGDDKDEDEDEDDFSDSFLRVMWYFEQVLLREEGVKEHGHVLVNYNMGKFGRVIELDEMEKLFNTIVDGSCLTLVVEHYCYDDPEMHNWVAGSVVFCDESFRHRLRTHFGNKSEVFFKLQTFGIPTHELPIKEDGETLDFTWHRLWLKAHRKKEECISDTMSIMVPRRFDVLFGRGSDTRVHSGNIRAQHLVEMRFEEYEQSGKSAKTRIAQEIVASIGKSFGRFLKWDADCDGWVEVDSDAARYKIAHFFRRRRITYKGKEKAVQVKSS